MAPRHALAVSSAVLLVVALAVSCKEPTQVTVEARTNVIYRSGITTAFTVGAPGKTETAEPTTEGTEPWAADGFVGSLTVVPASSDDGALSIKVVMGISAGTRACLPPQYAGCIVARRRLRYVPGERVRLPVTLYAECVDVPCDQGSTCNKLRQCVPADVDQASCADGTCVLPGESADGETTLDAGAGDVAADGLEPTIDAGDDASSSPPDAGPDGQGPVDGGTPGVVDCKGQTCPSPTVCCLTQLGSPICATSHLACQMAGGRTMFCDGTEDCIGGKCCELNGSTCGVGCGPYVEICHSNAVCSSGKTCSSTVMGYYRSCQ